MQITIKNLSHIYDLKMHEEFKALDNVSLVLPQDGLSAFVGHTGSGKTTMIKHFNCLIYPTSGEIEIGVNTIVPKKKGNKRNKNINDFRKDIGMVFQFPEDQIFSETVEEEILFGVKNFKLPIEEYKTKIVEYLNLVGLDESFINKNPLELSGGEKRKVAIASILILEQKLVILDEPTSSLDQRGIKSIYTLLRHLVSLGKKIIVVTHELKHVLEYADDVTLFANGKVVASGDPLSIIYNTKLLNTHSLDVPKLVELTNQLKSRGINIPISKTVDEFVKNYEKIRGQHV